ncbi:hypothetical protein RclHR1_00030057 [Rhizophagus clarus]|uniref:F-box domain-containing protein n=1 Tax=Rhizophagus clarus TaxID=94130 RepID=A0A2Z6R5X7_9GLOM|nr:hypothetical protein RclHR1_00030057 [Rhizophagus clarus]GES95569.1 hypothetical protein GLOIN_2v1474929 [Rhizophagus clarus]
MLLLNFFKKKKKDNGYSKTLPPELIRQIVLYLKNDKKSLHSCLLVSRVWCKETVDLLWRKPFHFLYTCNKINTSVFSLFKNSKSIINQCQCSKEKLQYQATNLLKTYLLIKHDKEFVKIGIINEKGERITFDYFEFLCALDLHELYRAVKDWNQWNKANSKFNKGNYIPLTFKSIIKYFFMNTTKLETFSLDTKFILYKINDNNPCSFLIKVNKYEEDDNYVNQCDNYIFNLLTNESKILLDTTQFFVNLNELVFTANEMKSDILFYLSQNCHNIQKLIITIGCHFSISMWKWKRNYTLFEADHLASLIRSQYNLVYFELFDTLEIGINVILNSLKESQYNSLKTLIFNNVFINNNSTILFYLKFLQNLQELRFNKCICKRNIMFDRIDIFDEEKNHEKGLWLPNLKYLQVDYIDENKVEFKELSFILSSILIRCSPLINSI